MRKHKIREYRDSKRPHLKFVVNTKESGKRVRAFFETKQEAQTFAQQKNVELLNGGVEAAQFPSALRIMASEATKRLAPFGKTIRDAVEFYLPHLQAEKRDHTIRQLVQELIVKKTQDGASARHLSDMRSRLGRFAAAFPNKKVSEFTETEIDQWIRALNVAPTTRNNFRRYLFLAFRFAVKNKYRPDNPAERPIKLRKKKTEVLTVQQAADLLTHADKEIVPAIALGLFAGLRPEAEGPYLDWSDIDFDEKEISIEETKVESAERDISMSENLIAWLLPYRKNKGAVFPRLEIYYQLLAEARKNSGIKRWPGDALRHCFGSYHYGAHDNAPLTMKQMGHTNAQIFFKHYRRKLKRSEALRYWAIRPVETAAGKKIVSISDA